MKFKVQLPVIVLALLLLVFFYIWPGVWRYQYDVMIGGVAKVDKLTGTFYSLESDHWCARSTCPFCSDEDR